MKVIREDLRLTGTKEACSAGHCGTCAVLMDGEVVLSCKYSAADAQDKQITTIEGIGTLDLDFKNNNLIGAPIVRRDALEKATGTLLYADDIALATCAHIKILRSPHHHARIRFVDKSAALAAEGVIDVLTGEDIKGTNILKMAGDDQPLLCRDKVRFIGDPVAAVA